MAETTNTTLALAADRRKYLQSKLDFTLRNALVAEKICQVDRSDVYRIENPYGSRPTAEVTHLTGTYTPAAYTVTDDTLTLVDEVKVGEHIFDFEKIVLSQDIMANRLDEHAYTVAAAIDSYVLNNLLDDAGESYSTPSGGFTTAANVNVIMGNLLSKVAGYAEAYNGLFLVIENTDIPGFVQAGAASGFSFSDSVMNNGFMNSYMGVDIYVVRSGLFTTATAGSTSFVTTGHRVFGVKGVATYATPRGVQFAEKEVTSKTGKEIVTWATIGFKLWATKANLVVDITLTA